MESIKITFATFLCVLLASCGASSVTVNNVTGQNDRQVQDVHFISSKESTADKGQKVADFVLKEDLNLDLASLRMKLFESAKQHGANIIEVNNIGYNLKGHGFYVDGNLYYSEDFQKVEDKCEIGFIRDRFESVLGSAFNIEVGVNGNVSNKLTKDKSLFHVVDSCQQNVVVQINNKEYRYAISGKSRYFKVGKQTSGSSNGVGVQVGIGGLAVTEIEDQELGRLMLWQNK